MMFHYFALGISIAAFCARIQAAFGIDDLLQCTAHKLTQHTNQRRQGQRRQGQQQRGQQQQGQQHFRVLQQGQQIPPSSLDPIRHAVACGVKGTASGNVHNIPFFTVNILVFRDSVEGGLGR